MVERVLPILQRRGVTAYLFGHDHDLQHIETDGLHYIGCGAGSEVRPVSAVKGTKFCQSRSGFAVLSANDSCLSLEFRDFTGASLYSAAVAI
jgi:acid phosphatase